ncbi:TonB-dependent receptor [Aquirhabdus sp.]|uniref:TonB-dependent receptor n=1 Tax=Aquirhabdus sp. TaxID=2824160 RepID=UPI00396C6110
MQINSHHFNLNVISQSILIVLAATCQYGYAADSTPSSDPQIASAKTTDSTPLNNVVVMAKKTTRSAVSLSGTEIQKALPGANPLKAIQTLPGVYYVTADPWGNNEQNAQLFVHGFSQQQLGYTFDGVPLGDQQYANYNGLSPQRAVISENVKTTTLNSGAGDLSTASTSNLGGTINILSSDPAKEKGLQFNETLGSYDTRRTFLRVDTGESESGNSLYAAYANQRARAWDFNGRQGGNQFNLKFQHADDVGKLTFFYNFSDKIEPNEDSDLFGIGAGAQTGATPYTRPFLYPDLNLALNYLGKNGALPAGVGNNFQNYYSAAQRKDHLAYLKYEWNLADNIQWSNQIYYHHDNGAGLVAGPISQAGLPALFTVYYPGQNLSQLFGGSGYATRETQYNINRFGYLSKLNVELAEHSIEAGFWYEHNQSTMTRMWFPFSASSPTTPYESEHNPLIVQYEGVAKVQEFQPYIQDQWHIRPDLTLLAGVKGSYQFAGGTVPVQQVNAASNKNPTLYPSGTIDTRFNFLPNFGLIWKVTPESQVFANIQKNARQFPTNITNAPSPWSVGSQAIFDNIAANVKPETSWTYELGLRSQNRFADTYGVTGLDSQISLYHVKFSNRLLSINPTPQLATFVSSSAPIVQNVGGVTTDGIDLSGTIYLGSHFSLYDGVSYNRSVYDNDYTSGTTTYSTSGKLIPATPEWMNKTVASVKYGSFEAQAIGDYVGKRYVTYTNDAAVAGYFLLGAEASYQLPKAYGIDSKLSLNVTNIANKKGYSSLVVNGPVYATSGYAAYPLAPRMFFITLSTKL